MTTTRSQPRILLVDDDAIDRMAVRRALLGANFDCELVEADTAPAALKWASMGNFDCVLLDFILPGVTALELLPRLKERLPETAFIALTGQGDEAIAVDLMKAGASDYLVKDQLDSAVLGRALRQTIALSATRAQLERVSLAGEHYAKKLRELVDATPSLFVGTTLKDRLSATVKVARMLLDSSEAFAAIVSEDVRVELIARESGVTAAADEDAAWSDAQSLVDSAATPSQTRAFCVLYDAAGVPVGRLAVRGPRPAPELLDVDVALLAHLGQMTMASVENLKLYETARKAVESRDTVMAVVSHDLRQPLSAFGIGLELLREGTTPVEQEMVLGRMERSSRQMKRLIDDLLDVVRIENRNLLVSPKRERLGPILDEVRELVAPLAEQRGINLLVVAAPDAEVLAERHRIVQVLANLVGNAISSTPRDGIIELRAEQNDVEVHLAVRDTGPGIDPAHFGSLFQRYWRKGGQGLGLGLYIAKAIVDAHGGRIWAESRLGEGATFTFSLPRAD